MKSCMFSDCRDRRYRRSVLETVLGVVRRAWPAELFVGPVEELIAGEESRAIRTGGVVVRVGPSWRSSTEAEWCYALAELLNASCLEVVPPIRNLSSSGATIRVEGHPVSVWPWIDATPGSRSSSQHRQDAAAVLARLHIVAAGLRLPSRPPMSATTKPMPELDDPQLDEWLDNFKSSRRSHAIHGDYYPGNLLFKDDRLVGVIDWDEAAVDAPEVELRSLRASGAAYYRTAI